MGSWTRNLGFRAYVKSTSSRPRKAKFQEDGQSYGSNVDLGFFYGTSFSESMAPNEMMETMLWFQILMR
jgi:hypothetical protein